MDKDKIIGYFIGCIKKAEDYRKLKKIAEAENVYIIQKYRRKGIGTSFQKEFLKWARTKRVKRARVVISAQNKKSIASVKKIGFKDYNLTLEKELK